MTYKNISNDRIAYLLNFVLFIIFFVIFLFSEGFYGGGDNLSHFKFSRAAFTHPEFLLDHWAKPVFTLLTAPFAQFGFKAVQMFNLIVGFFSGILCYHISKELNYKSAHVSSILLFFIPIYSIIVFSGMTEILFGFFILVSVYYFLKNKLTLGAILISFLPLIRTEGIYIVPIFGLILLLKKHYLKIIWLFTGFILYSIIGYFHFKDIFWLITKMPYRGAVDLYGTGSFAYFFENAHTFFGNTINLLLIIGILSVFLSFYLKKEKGFEEFFLIFTPFIIFFMGHVLMWWSGIGNSLGEHRYMTGIAPLVAIISLKGLNTLIRLIPEIKIKKIISAALVIIFLILIISHPFKVYSLPVKLGGTQKVTKECSDWIKKNNLNSRKIYLYDPDFLYFLNLNPFDKETCQELVNNVDDPGRGIEKGAIVLWDAHYCPNWNLTYEKMDTCGDFIMLKRFIPEHPFTMFKRDYEVRVYERK